MLNDVKFFGRKWATVVAQWQSAWLQIKRSGVPILPNSDLFSSNFFSYFPSTVERPPSGPSGSCLSVYDGSKQ